MSFVIEHNLTLNPEKKNIKEVVSIIYRLEPLTQVNKTSLAAMSTTVCVVQAIAISVRPKPGSNEVCKYIILIVVGCHDVHLYLKIGMSLTKHKTVHLPILFKSLRATSTSFKIWSREPVFTNKMLRMISFSSMGNCACPFNRLSTRWVRTERIVSFVVMVPTEWLPVIDIELFVRE